MRKVVPSLFVMLFFITSGCEGTEPKITKDQAKSIVVEHHSDSIGVVEILSITHKKNKYIIKWENKNNCENGVDKVYDQSGEIKMVEASIC